jgi:EAL domain-containing protein (putative c-di-GMP-specific phosphodiesterase class I)/GGDEF domain-containing protein
MSKVVQLTPSLQQSTEEALVRDIVARERVQAVFQPIIDLRKRAILGYESLTRGPEDTPFHKPIALFEAATTLGLESELEVVCRKNSIRAFAELGLDAKLFLNISPGALTNPGFKKGKTLRYLEEFGISPERVVIEVTEQHKTRGYRLLAEALAHYRSMGFTVALDDLGAGYSGLRLWTEVLPDYIKIDKHFIRNLHNDRIKLSFVTSLFRMASASNCQVIAEGVELEEELKVLQKIGITYVQGYYFARPQSIPLRTLEHCDFAANDWMTQFPLPPEGNADLMKISRQLEPLSPETTVNRIVDLFQKHPELQLLPIVEKDLPVGIINRHLFFNKLMATRFGVELYDKKPVRKLLEKQVILIDINSELESVSQRLIATPVPEQAFIITSEGKYHGVATVLDLLEIITEQKIQNARHANPLTLLPGIVPVNHVINKMLGERQSFSVAYFDLDNFKPYNDYYGYDAGDRIIQLLADQLRKVYRTGHALIGHIGGDDFIVMDSTPDYLANIKTLLSGFAEQVPQYYSQTHQQEGGITGIDRNGAFSFFGLSSVSVGVVPPEAVATCQSHIDIADLASEAKKLAKGTRGNSYFINRRAIVRP